MKHPSETELALLAGGDLTAWERWRMRRHISRCAACESELGALRAAIGQARELAAEMPKDLNWNRLAQEITGNIRVGLAAGEAIAHFDKPAASRRPRLAWNAGTLLACASVLFVAAFWLNLPRPQAQHLLQALQRIGSQGTASMMERARFAPDEAVVEASSAGIEVKENGRALSLMHPRSDRDSATVSVNMQGSAGVRFIDTDTGQVTTNKVYYAEP